MPFGILALLARSWTRVAAPNAARQRGSSAREDWRSIRADQQYLWDKRRPGAEASRPCRNQHVAGTLLYCTHTLDRGVT